APVGFGAGLVIGRDVRGGPTVVRMFRPSPTEVAMVGGLETAGVVILRAVAVGAHVYMRTSDPAACQPLVDATGGRCRVVTGLDTVAELTASAGPLQPVLLVEEVGVGNPGVNPEVSWRVSAGWQTRLRFARALTEDSARGLAGADLTILTRLEATEADVAVRTLGVDPETVPELTHLPDAMTALVGGGVDGYTSLAPTDWERGVIDGRPAPAHTPRTPRKRRRRS
ncbi:MAG: hypothetical protein ACQSGP_31365, partial [Frankia sp.]